MKKVFGLMLILFFPGAATLLPAQPSAADSLRRLYTATTDPGRRAELYLAIAEDQIDLDLATAPAYADTLEQLIQSLPPQPWQYQLANLRGSIGKAQGHFESALVSYKKALEGARQAGNEAAVAKACADVGACFGELYEPDSTIAYYLQSAAIYERNNDWTNIASTYANIGNLYSDQKQHEKAIDFLEKALRIRLEHGEEKKCMYTYNNLATAYGTAGQVEKAMDYAKKGIAIAQKYGNRFVAAVIEGGMGHLLNEKGRYPESIQHCLESARVLEELDRKPNIVFPLVNLATAYNALNQPDEALQYAMKGLAIMREAHLVDPLEVYYEEIAKAYEQKGNHREALSWYKQFMELDDSLFRADNVKNLADIETKYQTQKKETRLIQQDLALANQQSALFRQRTWLITLGIALLAIVAFGWLFYNRFRLRQKQILQEALIREQQLGLNAVIEAQETERKRIARELHDGIAQQMVALKMGFEPFRREQASPEFDELVNSLDAACREVRTISHVMSPPVLENKGLPGSLEMLLRNSLGLSGIRHQFENLGVNERLDEKVELGLYRITQELLNNIIKHAGASEVVVQLQKLGRQIILRVQDNGSGFDFDQAKFSGSMGLLNILSRVRTLNGSFVSEPGSPRGTISLVRIPILMDQRISLFR